MAFKPNYNQQRVERDRAKRALKDEKRRQQQERTAERKAMSVAPENTDEGDRT